MSDNSLSVTRVRTILRTLEERAPFYTVELTPYGAIESVATIAEVDELIRLGYLERAVARTFEGTTVYAALTTQAHTFLRGID